MKKEFKVTGMSCQKCVDKIEKFVGEIDGVELIEVDLGKKVVNVEFQSPANEKIISEAILDAGFEVVS
ncbi:copper ion binding protein [Helicobacter cappadocius]|uniref:Copper ion binding protein n=1 Tax=Helicobacter cappadocius TaxID=3063998 RepID=A0AA90PX39_9HELI|nr:MULTISPECIES: copper ion binding protein [unclassified Helicobacter]MDO7252321.1 copper ion binding protein [Helicobacter sp. faydin-H75]MDP2538188.1 copper ion binding protein [Helicobacter sp. faydin-H76]